MFGGFGGFGGGGGDKNNQPPAGFGGFGGFGGFPGMDANVNMTTKTSSTGGCPFGFSSSTTGSMPGGHIDPAKKSKDMQDKYKYREEKLPTYTALVDILELKGEDVSRFGIFMQILNFRLNFFLLFICR